jgi:phosphatidate phosphatase APP1
MLHVNFNTYNSYVTDSLYQWDINQELLVTGLNLQTIPEVHFNNVNMDRAIVRQASLVNGSVKVAIPNSLLQEAFTIKAYIGIYENDTFKVIELIEIPVIARKRPSDYVFTDTDEEIYSFKKLENLFKNTVNTLEVQASASAESARRAEQASANAVSEALNRVILKSDIVEIVKVTELPLNPSDNVLYVVV